MTEHTFSIDNSTIYGRFSAQLEPMVTIQSGDTVILETLDAGYRAFDNPNLDKFESAPKFDTVDTTLSPRHAMTGPICINGAKKGMVLEITFREIVPHTWGWSGSGYRENFIERYDLDVENDEIIWQIADDKQTAINKHGHQVTLSPFIGNIAMPPEATGDFNTSPPRWCGGNIDCKEIITGSTLYLPVPVDGAYLFVGDGHGVQGNGEVAGPALECAMSRLVLDITLHEERTMSMPLANTPAGWVTFGFDADLNKAQEEALYNMVTFLADRYGWTRTYAHGMISLLADLNITQIVNPIKGVHCIWPHDALANANANMKLNG